jgi:hypothetical protein
MNSYADLWANMEFNVAYVNFTVVKILLQIILHTPSTFIHVV